MGITENDNKKLLDKAKEEDLENTSEEIIEESKEEIEESKEEEEIIKKRKKVIICTVIFICTLFVIYFGMARYFTNHFYFGSKINSINVSGKTVEDGKKVISDGLQNYTLKLKERGGKYEQIKGSDIGLKYRSDDEIEKLKENQRPLKWISAFFTKKDSKMTVNLSFNEELLKKEIDKLSCFDKRNIVEPQNPSFRFTGSSYIIVDGISGNKVDKNMLYSKIVDSILKREAELDLESSGCYINPRYNSKSQKIIETRDTLNKYVSSKITYTFGDRKETLDSSIINKWLIVDKNFDVTIDKKKVKDYINGLAKIYNTVGKTRSFVTSYGKTINIGGGDYGWSINKTEEIQNLINAIKRGQVVTMEPSYRQTAFIRGDNDIGNTYVEIDLTRQHLWFYKNGSLIVEGDVVTGNVRNNHATPKGVYRLKYKQKNAILRGPGYAAHVTFWMPFNGGIGIHDASWRRVFGGKIYRTNGSHGCINSPYNVAKAVFYNIEANTPIICY